MGKFVEIFFGFAVNNNLIHVILDRILFQFPREGLGRRLGLFFCESGYPERRDSHR